jgi:pathogenesis-related protein 1
MMQIIIILLAAVLTTSSAHAKDLSPVSVDPKAFITAHNKWRSEVGVTEKLSYSQELAVSAQTWADTLKLTNQCQMHHSKPDGKYGENIFWASALNWSDGRKELQKVSPKKVVDSWGREKADYKYAKNSCTPGKMCGHYTQMVWRTTTTVGCAMAICENTQQQVWVCQYQPAGNWVGKKPY